MNAHQRRIKARKPKHVFDLEAWPTMDSLLKEFKGLAKGQLSMVAVRPRGPALSVLTGRSEGIIPLFDIPFVRRVNVLKERPAGGGFFIDMDFTKLEERIEASLTKEEA